MKKILFAAMAATVLFASCAKETSSTGPDDKQTIVVNLPNTVIGSRALGAPVATGTTTITAGSNVLVFLLNGNSVVDKASVAVDDMPYIFEQVSSTINRVIVVANHLSAEEPTILAKTNSSDILNYAFTIASQNPATDAGIVGKTLVGDQSTFDDGTNTDDSHKLKTFAVTLNAITARMEIGTVKEGEGIEPGTLSLVGIWVNNYRPDGATTTPTLHPDTYANWPTFISPAASTLTNPTKPTYAVTEYMNYSGDTNFGDVTLSSSTSHAYTFHVFAGTSATPVNLPHVIVLVKGKYKTGFYNSTDPAETDTYNKPYFMGYVTFDKYTESAVNVPSFLGNNIYKIGLDANGLTINAKDITPKPEMAKTDVKVSVSVNPWTPHNVTPGVQ